MARPLPNPLGGRLAVWLTIAVALLSVVTGVTGIVTTQTLGPVSDAVPAVVREVAVFTGALTGFLMLVSALGLRRGSRWAWYSTVVLLPLTAVQGLLQGRGVAAPLVVLSVVTLPVVARNRHRFDRHLSLTATQFAAVGALVGTLAYGTVGTYALRQQFSGIETLLDAFWYTLVTASTVGYGDATPTTQGAKLFGTSLLVLGTASFAIAAGALLGPAIEARFSAALGRMTEAQLTMLEDHVIVLGYGELTEPVLAELDGQVEFVVVAPGAETAAELGDRNFNVVTADPSDEEPLDRVGIEDARAAVAATNDDAEDALAILTARQLNPDVRIVAAATDRENVKKLKRAGADMVISPATIGGHLLVRSALGGDDDEIESIADRLLDRD